MTPDEQQRAAVSVAIKRSIRKYLARINWPLDTYRHLSEEVGRLSLDAVTDLDCLLCQLSPEWAAPLSDMKKE